MDEVTAAALVELNRKFYRNFGEAFAMTRRRLQPGIERLLLRIPAGGCWLDLGCGSGTLALHWAQTGQAGSYLGLDFSPELLQEAESSIEKWTADSRPDSAEGRSRLIRFAQADLGRSGWAAALEGQIFDGIFCFAALHHIPGSKQREAFLAQVRGLLSKGGQFMHSVWQFQHSQRMLARQLPWDRAGLDAGLLESGDTLLDWRFSLPGQEEKVGLRYVHQFNPAELCLLAKRSGFRVVEEFESDGKEGKLGLYQVWQAV